MQRNCKKPSVYCDFPECSCKLAKEETVEETVEELLRHFKSNPKLTVKKLEQQLNLSRRGIEYHIANLKKEGRLKRIGSTKSGYWKVIEK